MSGHGMAGPLHYGDVITLASPELGYVSSTGLADEGLRVDVYPKDVYVPANLEDCQFEVCNKFVYTSAKLLIKELAREGKTLDDWEKNARLCNPGGPAPPGKSFVELEAAVMSERAVNHAENARSAGRPLCYGCVVQLRHVASGKFVTLHKARARLECNSIKVLLQPHGSEASWLVVQPGYRTKLLGDTVASSDTVTLASVKYSTFCLRVSRPSDEEWAKAAHEYVTDVKEVCAAAPDDISRCRFRVALFSPAASTVARAAPASLKPGDLLVLLHRATGCWLVCEDGRVVFREPDPADDCVNCNALWTIEAQAVEAGGSAVVAVHQKYRLKHVASTKFLEAPPLQPEDCVEVSAMLSQRCEETVDDISGMESLMPSQGTPADTSPKTSTTPPRSPYMLVPGTPGSRGRPEPTVQLTSQYAGQATLWSLHCVHREGEAGGIPYSASINIESADQGTWLGQARREGASIDGAGWPREHPATLLASRDVHDALGVRVVGASILPRLAEHRAAVRQLSSFVEQLRQTPALVTEGKSAQEVLQQMRTRGMRDIVLAHGPAVIRTLEQLALSLSESDNPDPLTRKGVPVRQHQALLLELKALDAILDLLHVLFGPPAQGGKGVPPTLPESFTVFAELDLLRLCRLCHAVLQGAARGYPPTQRQLSRRAGVLSYGLAGDVGASETMCQVYSGNGPLTHQVPAEQIAQLVGLLQARRLPRFLRVLATICAVNGSPVLANQNKVVDAIFGADVLVTARVEMRERTSGKGEEPTLVIYRDGEAGLQVDCRTMFDSMDDVANKDATKLTEQESLFLFHLSQLHLFSAVCQQRNRKATDALLARADTLGVGYPDLLAIAFHPRLPYPLRSAAVVLMQHLFVDREPLEAVRPLHRTLIWPALEEANVKKGKRPMDAFAAFPGKGPEPGFVSLKDKLMGYLRGLRGGFSDASHVPVNVLSLAMIRLAEAMLAFGVLGSLDQQDSKMAELVQVLVELLDGRDDASPPGRSRFTYSKDTAPIVDAKLAICRILLLCYDMAEGKRVAATFSAYCQTSTARPDGYEGEVDGGIESPRPQTPGGEVPGTPSGEGVPLMKATGPPGRSFFASNRVVALDGVISQDLLNDLESKLFQVPLLGPRVPPVEDVRQELPDLVGVLLDLSRYEHPSLQTAAFALLERHMAQRGSFVRALQQVNVVAYPDVAASYQQARAHLAEFRRLLKWVVCDDPKQRKDARAGLSLILTWLNAACSLGPTSDKVAVRRRQKLLCDLDAIQLAVELLRVPLALQSSGNGQVDVPLDPELRNVFAACYEFLKRAAGEVPNADNQRLLFGHRQLFIAHMAVERLGVAADALAACVRDNPTLASQVSSADVRAVFDAIDRHGRRAQGVSLLESLLVVRRKPVPRHQDMVLRLLLQYERVACFCTTSQEQAERQAWMRDEGQLSNADSPLRYHAACVRLVALCCVGNNEAARVKAARLISFEFAMANVLRLHQMGTSAAGTTGGARIPPRVVRYVKGAFVDALCTLYAQSSSERAASDVRKPNNGIWPPLVNEVADPTLAAELAQQGSLLQVFLDDVQEAAAAAAAAAAAVGVNVGSSGAANASSGDSNRSPPAPGHPHTSPSPTDAFRQDGGAVRYVLSSVLPMLSAYFHVHFTTPYMRLAEPHRQLLFHLATKVELLHNTLPATLRGPSSALLSEMDELGVLVKAEGSRASSAAPAGKPSPSAAASSSRGASAGTHASNKATGSSARTHDRAPGDPTGIYDVIGTLGALMTDPAVGSEGDARTSMSLDGPSFDSLQLMGRPSGNESFLRGWADFWRTLARHLGVQDLAHFSDGGGRDLAMLLSRDSTVPRSSPPFRFRVVTRHLVRLLAVEADACAGGSSSSGTGKGVVVGDFSSGHSLAHADMGSSVDVFAYEGFPLSRVAGGAVAAARIGDVGRVAAPGSKTREMFGAALTARFLRLLRGMLYVTDPANEALGDGGKHKDDEWAAAMSDNLPSLPAVFQECSRLSETDAASLATWVQGKYCVLGVHVAAVRLAGHPDALVQNEACRLLVAMLDGCPEEVRGAVVAVAAQDVRLLARLQEWLRRAVTEARAASKALLAARRAREAEEVAQGGDPPDIAPLGASTSQGPPVGSGRFGVVKTTGSSGSRRLSVEELHGGSARRSGGVEPVGRGTARSPQSVIGGSAVPGVVGASGYKGAGGASAEEPSVLKSGVLALALRLMEALCREHDAGGQLLLAGAGAGTNGPTGASATLDYTLASQGPVTEGGDGTDGIAGSSGTDLVASLVALFEVLPHAVTEGLSAGDAALPELAQQVLRSMLACVQGPCRPNVARLARGGFLLASRSLMESISYVLPLDAAAQSVLGGLGGAALGATPRSGGADALSPRVSLVRFQVVPPESSGREHAGSSTDSDKDGKDGTHKGKEAGKGALSPQDASAPPSARSRADMQCALRLCVLDVWLAMLEETEGKEQIPRRLAALADVTGLLAQLRLLLKLVAYGDKGAGGSGKEDGSMGEWAAERVAFGKEAEAAFASAVARLHATFTAPDADASLREEALKTTMLLQKLAPFHGKPEAVLAAWVSADGTLGSSLLDAYQEKADKPPRGASHPFSTSFLVPSPSVSALPFSSLPRSCSTCMATGCSRACPPGDSAKVWEPVAGRGGRWVSFCLSHVLQRDPALQRFSSRNVAAVEVVRAQRVERVLFPITRECRALLDEGLEEWQEEVSREIYSLPRDNVQLKALGFVDRAKYLCLRLQHYRDMESRRLGSRHTQDLHRRLLAAPYLLSLIILIIIVIRYGRDWDDWSADHNLTAWIMVQVLSWSTLAICLLSAVLWMRLDAPLVVYELHNPCAAMQEGKRRRWLARKLAKVKRILPSKAAAHGHDAAHGGGHDHASLHGLLLSDTMAFQPEPPLGGDPSAKSFKTLRNVVVPVEILVRAVRRAPALDATVWKRLTGDDVSVPPPPLVASGKKGRLLLRASSALKELLTTPPLLYGVCKVAISLLGCIWTPFFFSLHFADFLVSTQSGRGLVEVAQIGVASLLKTATLAILLLTMYGLGTFVFFNGHHNACTTLYECVGNHLVAGFAYSGKGVADVGGTEHGLGLGWGTAEWEGVPAQIQSAPRNQAHVAYVFLVAVVWTYLIANIATAQIVAAFALVREKTRRQQQDLENKCFICSLDRLEFEQRCPGSFNEHIQNVHNPFVYIFFVHYVLQKSLSKCTGMESYVKDHLAKETLDWLPIGITRELSTSPTALCLRERCDASEDDESKDAHAPCKHAAKLDEALRLLAGMNAKLKALESKT